MSTTREMRTELKKAVGRQAAALRGLNDWLAGFDEPAEDLVPLLCEFWLRRERRFDFGVDGTGAVAFARVEFAVEPTGPSVTADFERAGVFVRGRFGPLFETVEVDVDLLAGVLREAVVCGAAAKYAGDRLTHVLSLATVEAHPFLARPYWQLSGEDRLWVLSEGLRARSEVTAVSVEPEGRVWLDGTGAPLVDGGGVSVCQLAFGVVDGADVDGVVQAVVDLDAFEWCFRCENVWPVDEMVAVNTNVCDDEVMCCGCAVEFGLDDEVY